MMGGVLVIKDGEPKYFWGEELFGGFAPIELEIMPMLRHLAGQKCS